jgi:hypothetical protein
MPPAGNFAVAPEGEGQPCLNCGAIPAGAYCQACGQRCREGRLTVAQIGRWFVNDLLDFDRGLLLTVREMTLRPGAMIRGYVAGQRRRYTNPFTYLVLCAGLSLLGWALISDAFLPQMKATIVNASRTMWALAPAQQARLVELQVGLIPYSTQLGLFLCLPFAALLRLFFRKSGYNFAEVFVFALFASGQHYLVSLVLTAALFPFSRSYNLYGWVTFSLYVLIYAQAARGFFKRGFGTFAKVFFAIGITFLAFSFAQLYALREYVRLTAG